MITASQNYRVTSRVTPVRPTHAAAIITGAFDPARGIGAESIDGVDLARYDGRYIYLRILPGGRKVYEQYYKQNFHLTLQPGQIWERVTVPKPDRSPFTLMIEPQVDSVQSVKVLSPQGLVVLVKAASHIRGAGHASGLERHGVLIPARRVHGPHRPAQHHRDPARYG